MDEQGFSNDPFPVGFVPGPSPFLINFLNFVAATYCSVVSPRKGALARMVILAVSAGLILPYFPACGQWVSMNADLDLSTSEISALTEKAAKGDKDAAWRLFLCYSLARSDKKNEDVWLCRAAELKNTNAERELAEDIKERNHSPGSFGATGLEAFHKLLEQASHTDGQACYELASAYADGYPGPLDCGKARYYYSRGAQLADRMCWEKLSQFCHKGLGGDRDEASAYFWISLETRCVDPRSIGGKEEWAEREDIAKQLTLKELKSQWERIDQYISQVRAGKISVYDTPFGKGLYHPDESEEGTRLSDEAEIRHRQKMQHRGT